LLQGVYAFAGVADTWRALSAADELAAVAQQRFAETRLQVDRSLSTIEASGALTEAGTRLLTHLRTFTDGLLCVPVPAPVARQAERRMDAIRSRWLAANSA